MIKNIMLDLNISILYVFAFVWILMLVLNKVFYKPIGRIMDARESKIEKESKQLEDLKNEIEKKTGQIEDILIKTKKGSTKIKEEMIRKGEEIREQIVMEARDRSKKIFGEKMNELEEEISMAEKKIKNEIETFSNKIREIFI